MRWGYWKSPWERSVGQAAAAVEVEEGVVDEERNGVTVGVAAVPVAGRVVGSKVGTVAETEVEEEFSGLPRAVQLNPPVLNVTVSQPVVFCNGLEWDGKSEYMEINGNSNSNSRCKALM